MRISDWSSDVCSPDPTRREGDGVLLGNADVEGPVRKRLFKQVQSRSRRHGVCDRDDLVVARRLVDQGLCEDLGVAGRARRRLGLRPGDDVERSEEHTSELQSLMRISYAVFCLKKKKDNINIEKNKTTTHT